MTTKAIFNIDTKVKAKVQKKARRQGLTFSHVMNFAAKAYAEDKFEIDVLGLQIEQARQQIREGKSYTEEEVYKRFGIKMKK